jgi:hypothetical protein
LEWLRAPIHRCGAHERPLVLRAWLARCLLLCNKALELLTSLIALQRKAPRTFRRGSD